MKKTFAILAMLILSGCMTEPKIEATKPWEDHYYTVDELKKIVDSIELDKDESIWLMSNHTLNRLLKNTRK